MCLDLLFINHNKCNTVTKYGDTCQTYQLLLCGPRLIEPLDKCVQSIDLTSWFRLRWLKLLSSNTTWIGNSYEGFGPVSCRCWWQCWSPVDQSGHRLLLLAATAAVKRHNSSSTQGCHPTITEKGVQSSIWIGEVVSDCFCSMSILFHHFLL